jgi:hypothetical protein
MVVLMNPHSAPGASQNELEFCFSFCISVQKAQSLGNTCPSPGCQSPSVVQVPTGLASRAMLYHCARPCEFVSDVTQCVLLGAWAYSSPGRD